MLKQTRSYLISNRRTQGPHVSWGGADWKRSHEKVKWRKPLSDCSMLYHHSIHVIVMVLFPFKVYFMGNLFTFCCKEFYRINKNTTVSLWTEAAGTEAVTWILRLAEQAYESSVGEWLGTRWQAQMWSEFIAGFHTRKADGQTEQRGSKTRTRSKKTSPFKMIQWDMWRCTRGSSQRQNKVRTKVLESHKAVVNEQLSRDWAWLSTAEAECGCLAYEKQVHRGGAGWAKW